MEDVTVHEALLAKLADSEYRLLEHEGAATSEESARIRGTQLSQGAKALILRSKGEYLLVVISASTVLDAKALRKRLKLKSLSFASETEVWEQFKLRKGAVPPFGSVLGIPTYADEHVRALDEIVFNAGLRTRSVFLTPTTYAALEKPTWIECVKDDV